MTGIVLLPPDAGGIQNITPGDTATGVSDILLSPKQRTGLAQSGGNTTIVLAAAESALEDIFNGWEVRIDAGTGAGQTRKITLYAGSSKTATVSTWTTNPDNTSRYTLIPRYDGMQARRLLVQAQTNTAKIRTDGGLPTAAAGTNLGLALTAGATWQIDGVVDCRNFRCIDDVSGSASVEHVLVYY